jgi:hypothetical protein
MVSRRIPIRAPRRGQLTHSERCWLLYGFDPRWAGAFIDRADFQDAWAHHRGELMRETPPARRPLGWWHLESPCRFPGHDRERQVLYEQNLLGAAEREELIAEWREDFAKGWTSDVPPSLWEQWQNEETPVPAA